MDLPASSSGQGLWGGELEHEVLTAKASRESVYQEAAFFHKPSKTLLLCDAVVSTGVDPPPILTSEPEYTRALLYHARRSAREGRGHARGAPQGLAAHRALRQLLHARRARGARQRRVAPAAPKARCPSSDGAACCRSLGKGSTPRAFEAFRDDGKPVVVPIIQIILSRAPEASKAWIDTVTSWDFERVVPAHFDAPIAAGPAEFRATFDFIAKGKNEVRFCDEDVLFLREALEGLPPDLALFDTPLGSLRGRTDCAL